MVERSGPELTTGYTVRLQRRGGFAQALDIGAKLVERPPIRRTAIAYGPLVGNLDYGDLLGEIGKAFWHLRAINLRLMHVHHWPYRRYRTVLNLRKGQRSEVLRTTINPLEIGVAALVFKRTPHASNS